MLDLFEITDLAAIEVLLAGIPESVGLLVFGIGLVVLAVLIRRVLGRGETDKEGRESHEKGLVGR